jgi:hypothetical protein
MSSNHLKDSEKEVRTLKMIQKVGSQNPKTVKKVCEMMVRDYWTPLKLMESQL